MSPQCTAKSFFIRSSTQQCRQMQRLLPILAWCGPSQCHFREASYASQPACRYCAAAAAGSSALMMPLDGMPHTRQTRYGLDAPGEPPSPTSMKSQVPWTGGASTHLPTMMTSVPPCPITIAGVLYCCPRLSPPDASCTPGVMCTMPACMHGQPGMVTRPHGEHCNNRGAPKMTSRQDC